MDSQKEWSNWSGSLKFIPSRIEKPDNEEQLVALVKKANEEKFKVRVVLSSPA